MPIPSLLSNKNQIRIPESVFADLHFPTFLSQNAIRILACPLKSEDILLRQELFSRLEDEAFRARVEDCLAHLENYHRALMLWKNSDIPLEKLFLQASVLKGYTETCQQLASFTDGGALFSAVANFFHTPERIREWENAKKAHTALTKDLQKMNTFLVSFMDKQWVTPNDPAPSPYSELLHCAQNLGITVTAPKSFRQRIDPALSEAVLKLYSAQSAQSTDILTNYQYLYAPPQYINELKFYLEICRLIEKAEAKYIRSCMPVVSNTRKFTAQSLYDISLIASDNPKIVPNNTYFTEKEPFFFLVGANGGGKTTYLRAAGINMILFLAGCPVFAHRAEIYPFSSVFTHFPSDERFDGMGRLDEEQKRTEAILQQTDANGFLLFNETFSGTDETKGYSLLLDTVKACEKKTLFGLYVTHFHIVSQTDYPILQAEIDPTDENRRTYRILPKNTAASSYAEDILKKYKLDKVSLLERRERDEI